MIRKTLVLVLLFSVAVLGANVHGTVYRWNDLESVPAVVRVTDTSTNELIHQQLANVSGYYSIDLGNGEYTINAIYGNLSASQDITLNSNDSKGIDLVLTPGEDYLFPDFGELPSYDGSNESFLPEENLGDESNGKEAEGVSDFTIYFAVAVLIILLSLTYFLKIRGEKVLEKKKHIPSDEEETLKILKESGGEAYQSEVKDGTGFSASKTSELLSKMEEKGLITREKKGRKKIVRLN